MKTKRLFGLLLVALLLPACSMLTESGRRQAAYARYVNKSSKARMKQQKMFRSSKPAMPITTPSEPVEDSGPVAVAENVP